MCFKNDLTAADICGVNRNTVNRYYGLLRRAILSESIREARARKESCQRNRNFWSFAKKVLAKFSDRAADKSASGGTTVGTKTCLHWLRSCFASQIFLKDVNQEPY